MPEFVFGLVADAAQIDANGKLSILGEFDNIYATRLPAQHGPMTIVARWEADKAEVEGRQGTLQMEINGPDGESVLPRSASMDMKWGASGPGDPRRYRANALLGMVGLPLKAYGGHVIRFRVNGEPLGEIRFYVSRPEDRQKPPNVNA
jgi:hypothetical protein